MFDTYAEIFAERATAYHAAMAQCPQAREVEFRAMLDPLRNRSGLLCDMPSGGGYLAAYVPADWRYVGVDPAEDFIEACPTGLERIKSAITNVPLEDGSLDAIVSLAGLHHEPDLALVFEEMRRLLKPGGRAVLADVAIETSPAGFLNGFVDRNNPMGHEGRFLDGNTAGTFEAAGLRIVEDRLVDVPWVFDSLEEAGEFCRHLFGMTGLGAQAVADARADEIGFDEDGGKVRLKWVLRRIVGEAV